MEIKYGRNRKGIKADLDDFITGLLDTIDDENVKKAVKDDIIITGGSICSMLMGDKINDYDVYFRTIGTTEIVAKYYVDKFVKLNPEKIVNVDTKPFIPEVQIKSLTNLKKEVEERVVIYIKSAGVVAENQTEYKYFEMESVGSVEEFAESLNEVDDNGKSKYRPIFLSQNAITLSNSAQIVIRFYGNPKEIHNNYDFAHAMSYYDYANGDLYFDPKAMECMLSRTLIYHGSLYPIASIFRAKKFIERGWRIGAGQLLKIMWQISEIDLSDHEVLQEQLTGVDQAYLRQIIHALKDTSPEKINSAYVCTIIERVFE